MQVERASNRGVRLRNRSALLTRLFLEGPLTRQDLSRRTGLSQPAVSNVVSGLIDEGIVEEAGALESDGGRPSMMLRVDPAYGVVAGVDVGETRVRVELFDLGLQRLAEHDHPIEPGGTPPEAVAGHILTGLHTIAADRDILGAGVGVSGIVQQRPEGALVHAQTLGQAEMWFGAGRGRRHAVFALVGSGVGAAVVTNGTTYRGVSSSAGEWGHTTLVYGGRPCRCGSRGCLEAYVGAEAILDRYQERSGRPAPGADEESQLTALLATDDPDAVAVLAETADYLGAGVANLVNLFNPELVVLGGWAAIALEPLLPRIRESARRHALRQPFDQTRIELGRLGLDAVALGAATLPIARLLTAGGTA